MTLNKVGLVSLLVTFDPERNFSTMVDAVKQAHAGGCQLVCFPECALTGIPEAEDYESDIERAVEIPGNITRQIGELAKIFQLHIATGLLERDEEKIFDTALLFDPEGEILLEYRRITPKWHSPHLPKHLYREGTTLPTASTSLGKFALALCGDLFDNGVVSKIRSAKPDYLIVPLSRSFAGYTPEWWDREEKWFYSRQVAQIGIPSFLVNSFESQAKWPSLGGSLVISSEGRIMAESPIGKPSFLVCDFPRSV